MCIFFDQLGNVAHKYKTYGVDEIAPYKPEPRVRPNTLLNLLAAGTKGPEQHRGNWGFGTGKFDWNARDDRLDSSPLWRTMWMQRGHHVVVPMTHAYESTKRTGDRRWFAVERIDDEPLWVPALGRIQKGAHRTEWHVSLVTVDAGPVFDAVHDTPREIVALRDWKEAAAWLEAADEPRMRSLLRPAGPDVLRAYRVSDDVLKADFPPGLSPQPYEAPRQSGLDAFT